MNVHKLRFLILIVIVIAFCSQLAAQRLKVSSYAEPTSIGRDEYVTYTIEVSGGKGFKATAPDLPPMEDFSLMNMMTSTSSSYSIVNGNFSESVTKSYIYRLLPKRTGNLKIPEVRINIGGQLYITQPLEVRVLDLSQAGRSPSSQGSPYGGSQSQSLYMYDPFGLNQGFEPIGEIDIVAVPEKRTVYVGEPLLVTYKLYTNQPVAALELKDEKDFGGYGKAMYSEPTRLNFENTVYKEQRYKTAVIKVLAVLPNRAGEIELPQLTASVQLGSVGLHSKTLQSGMVRIRVNELPAQGRPVDFTGAVGRFKVSDKLEKTTARVGEALEYMLVISGRGNFNQFSNPIYPPQQEFRIASPLADNQLQAGISGTRTINYLLIPQNEGNYTLPGIDFNWFDPGSGTYQRFNSVPRQVEIKPGNVLTYISNVFQRDNTKVLSVFKPAESYTSGILLVNSTVYWLIAALIILSLLPSWIVASNKKLKDIDPELAAQKSSAKVLKKYLKEAEAAAMAVSSDFYPKAERGLMRYLSDKYHVSHRFSTREKIYQLSLKGLDQGLIVSLENFLQRCQEARFMPGGFNEEAIQADLENLKKIIKAFIRLPDKIRKPGW